MKKELIDRYRINIIDKYAPNYPYPSSQVLRELKKILRQLPLELATEGSDAKITYYPNGGDGSAAIPRLIRFYSDKGIDIKAPFSIRRCPEGVNFKFNRNPCTKDLKFVYLSKCLCFKFKDHTIEVLTEESSAHRTLFKAASNLEKATTAV